MRFDILPPVGWPWPECDICRPAASWVRWRADIRAWRDRWWRALPPQGPAAQCLVRPIRTGHQFEMRHAPGQGFDRVRFRPARVAQCSDVRHVAVLLLHRYLALAARLRERIMQLL